MKIEVLLSTMNQKDLSIVKKMNIQTDVLIINQTDNISYIEEVINGNRVRMFSFNERGIGLSRNNALMRSEADICLMADDDMIYEDDYEETVRNAFLKNKKAEFIIFNVPIFKRNGKKVIKVTKNGRVRFYNGLKYGTVNFGFKREVLLKHNMFFSTLFGASKYGSGEDSLFLTDSLKNKIKVYTCKEVIAHIEYRESSWNVGVNEKYLFDRGALFEAISGSMSLFLILQFAIRHYKMYSSKFKMTQAIQIMRRGSNDFKKE